MASGQKDKRKDLKNNFFSHFPRWDSLFCGSESCSYDLTKEQTQNNIKSATKSIISKLFSGSKPIKQPLTEDEKHLFALFNEGLLLSKHVYIRDNKERRDKSSKSPAILTTFDHPVLNICLGFTDRELREHCSIQKYRTSPAYAKYSETCPIRAGIERVLSSNHEADVEATMNGIPLSLWLDMYDPAIQLMLMLKTRRGRRSSLTKRRKHQLFLRPNQPAPIMGDVTQDYFQMMGPIGRQHRNIMAVVSFRFGELGERNRYRRHLRINDTVVQTMRQPNPNRSRTTQAFPMNVAEALDPIERAAGQNDAMFAPIFLD